MDVMHLERALSVPQPPFHAVAEPPQRPRAPQLPSPLVATGTSALLQWVLLCHGGLYGNATGWVEWEKLLAQPRRHGSHLDAVHHQPGLGRARPMLPWFPAQHDRFQTVVPLIGLVMLLGQLALGSNLPLTHETCHWPVQLLVAVLQDSRPWLPTGDWQYS